MDFTYLRPRKVWAALEGHPDRPHIRTVERWCETGVAPAWANEAIRQKLGHEEAAPPKWAERLADETVTKVIQAVTTPERWTQIETLIERLEGLAPLPGEASDDPAEAQDRDGSGQPGRAVG